MPELPEVEVVRAGLAPALTGARVLAVEVRDPRALKRHVPLGLSGAPSDDGLGGHGVTLSPEAGLTRAADFERRLTGARLGAPARRGKFMWVPVGGALGRGDCPDSAQSPLALLAHLGMSGQMLLRSPEAEDDRHVRIRLWIEPTEHTESLEHAELRLDFADQRLFGSLALDALVPTLDGAPGGHAAPGLLGAGCAGVASLDAGSRSIGADPDLSPPAPPLIPSQAAHIARDPLDPAFDDAVFVAALRSRSSAVKQVLLDQGLVSGVGNIYADEALWRARIHPGTLGRAVGPRKARALLAELRAVFAQALAEGGTSFDAQYVNVNGAAGYFAHSLNAYGRAGEPCPRCGDPIRRIPFGGRSSHFCPRCQRRR